MVNLLQDGHGNFTAFSSGEMTLLQEVQVGSVRIPLFSIAVPHPWRYFWMVPERTKGPVKGSEHKYRERRSGEGD
jgi:hypothetical protein